MNKYKIGDKVRILSDAKLGTSTVTKELHCCSAIGAIGTIDSVHKEGVRVKDLYRGCYDNFATSWLYTYDQVELIENHEDTQPITKDNIVDVLEYNGFESVYNPSWMLKDYMSISIEPDKRRFTAEDITNSLTQQNYVGAEKESGSEKIKTTDFNEFLAFVKKRISIKPIPTPKDEFYSKNMRLFTEYERENNLI